MLFFTPCQALTITGKLDFLSKHYIKYDNALEGIGDGCKDDPCEYHVWNGLQFRCSDVARVPAPVPDYSFESFAYATPRDIKAGNLTSRYDLNVQDMQLNH